MEQVAQSWFCSKAKCCTLSASAHRPRLATETCASADAQDLLGPQSKTCWVFLTRCAEAGADYTLHPAVAVLAERIVAMRIDVAACLGAAAH
jgi:hypothetical protein